MKKSFNHLQLNKKTIAKLNEDQLSNVKGGNSNNLEMDTDCRDGGITCNGATATVVTGN